MKFRSAPGQRIRPTGGLAAQSIGPDPYCTYPCTDQLRPDGAGSKRRLAGTVFRVSASRKCAPGSAQTASAEFRCSRAGRVGGPGAPAPTARCAAGPTGTATEHSWPMRSLKSPRESSPVSRPEPTGGLEPSAPGPRIHDGGAGSVQSRGPGGRNALPARCPPSGLGYTRLAAAARRQLGARRCEDG